MKTPARAPMRVSYHHGDLRHALVEAAVRLVAERGVQGFSLREAAREVSVSPAAAYRHFEDKAALLGAVALDGLG
ncbi:MAG TPA: helix-turn-helix domain-containing protein, partial [Anaeromyxobacteraceae bacterium]